GKAPRQGPSGPADSKRHPTADGTGPQAPKPTGSPAPRPLAGAGDLGSAAAGRCGRHAALAGASERDDRPDQAEGARRALPLLPARAAVAPRPGGPRQHEAGAPAGRVSGAAGDAPDKGRPGYRNDRVSEV